MPSRPLMWWTLALAAGIGAAGVRAASTPVLLVLAGCGLLLLGAGGRRRLLVAGVVLTGAVAGALRLAAYQQVSGNDVSRWNDRPASVLVAGDVVTDPETHAGGRLTLTLRVRQVGVAGQTPAASGLCYVSLASQALGAGPLPDYGDRVLLRGRLETPAGATNPGAFSWQDYLARRGTYAQLRVVRPGALTIAGTSGLNPALRLAWHVRRRLLVAVRAALPPTEAALLSGILIGRRTDLPPDLMADFVKTGTVHILASAGLHVGIVAWWLLRLCARLTLPRKLSASLTVLLLWTYALMAGGRPSVTRAVVMATLYLGAILFEREPDLPTSLAAAALLILWSQPTALWESGFQMSFLTVVALAVLMPVWEGFWRPRVQSHLQRPKARQAALWGLGMAGLALGAQLGAAPVVAASYNEVSLSGVAANLLVVPVLFVLIPLGFAGALLSGLWGGGGAGLLWVAGLGLRYVAAVVHAFGEASWSALSVPTPSVPVIALYYAVIGGAVYAFARRRPPVPTEPTLS